MSFFSRLFGGSKSESKAPSAKPEEYAGYLIYAEPRKNGPQWQTMGRITKDFDGEVKEHVFIRADTHGSEEEAITFTLRKGRQIVDEAKDAIFDQ
ncbi:MULTISPECIES: HlyU family transcriptional regulator [Pseudovibrio]|uniref:HlyU family transcriptional regulator n=1 Tax=Stappiaceae TaxID=2821832 RepID=UPI002365FFE9|nr:MULTISPECIES: HlyU family transcriptional regulator [Pseudovibrio]MDD7910214.1 HlyU family transcriptional regulator [Pseudovibrio exalbescens]MDX5593927.1 HlyU family transcriptional regulator [Pseudovibrio sp. SPO723]